VIETLRIANLAIVERAEVEFGPGLNALTGETGAGKSIVLGALGLLAGARASAEAIRAGAEEARVEAVFRTERLPALEAELRERGLEPDGHELVVARTLGRGGRSRAEVAGRLVPVSTLAELFEGRLEISSQHESQSLRRPESHARLLDAFGGLGEERRRVEEGHALLRAARAECHRLEAESAARERRRDFLAFQIAEIEEIGPEPGELERLAAEHARLAHAAELRDETAAAATALAGDPGAPETPGAGDALDAAARGLAAVAAIDPQLAGLAERLRALHVEVEDAARDLERYADRVDVDPARLTVVEQRLARLEHLRTRYGASEEEILAFRDTATGELADLGGADERLAELRRSQVAAEAALREAAERLSRGRARAGRLLAKAAERALRALDMPAARLEVGLAPVAPADGLPCGPGGAEQVEFLLAANPGEPARALRRVASGGELSRIFLALRGALRRAGEGMILVFDEVDAGIGGRAANRVGTLLAKLAADHQVLCITHWPQIAAAAATHHRAVKGVRGGRTGVRIEPLAERERIEELARMAGGDRVTEATRRHARELLAGGRRGRETDLGTPGGSVGPSPR
jgi:DNA repair protein RecN (Recombination protein N)